MFIPTPSSDLFYACMSTIAGVCLIASIVVTIQQFCPQKVRRLLAACGLALVLALTAGPVMAAANDVVMVNECAPYSSSDWQWYALGCWMLPSK